jgi:predicted DNA-binding ribbon-helix-helix protein
MLAEQRNIGLGVAVALLAKEGLRSIATRRLASGNHTVTVRLDDAEFEEVKVIAKQRGIDVASAVNLLVKRALLNKSKPPG